MSSKFQKKTLTQLKKQEEAVLDRDLEDFTGTAAELFFIKLGRRIQRNRVRVFLSFLGFFLVFGSVLGYLEYRDYQETKSTEELEIILEGFDRTLTPVEERLDRLKTFHESSAYGAVKLRSGKLLADQYIALGNYSAAAGLMEETGKGIESLRESKAYFFYLAGNYRELGGETDLALANYETASRLLENLRETAAFRAWSLYQTGRLKLEKGDKAAAGDLLRKVLIIEPGEANSDLTEVKKLSTFLLLKLSQKD
jgi:tetratricopeptide (TPR) repeat protein